MKKPLQLIAAQLSALPGDLHDECIGALYRPITALQERILNLRGPYADLRDALGGFDPAIKFVIDRAEAGDDLARQTRDEALLLQRMTHLASPRAALAKDCWREFFTTHAVDFQEFRRVNYPWLVLDFNVIDPNRSIRDPALDEVLNRAIANSIGTFGFRRLSNRFRSDYLGEPLFLVWDRGSWSMSISLLLEMRHREFFAPLGTPFSSGSTFDFNVAARIDVQLHHFSAALSLVFPEFIEALRSGMRGQDRLLQLYGG